MKDTHVIVRVKNARQAKGIYRAVARTQPSVSANSSTDHLSLPFNELEKLLGEALLTAFLALSKSIEFTLDCLHEDCWNPPQIFFSYITIITENEVHAKQILGRALANSGGRGTDVIDSAYILGEFSSPGQDHNYLANVTGGIGARGNEGAWELGFDGGGSRANPGGETFALLESGWNACHDDFRELKIHKAHGSRPECGNVSHGTSVLSIVCGKGNIYKGVAKGLTEVFVSSVHRDRHPTVVHPANALCALICAIAHAKRSLEGAVFLLEICCVRNGNQLPLEVETETDGGLILELIKYLLSEKAVVIEAAGNSSIDLDPILTEPLETIIVGGGICKSVTTTFLGIEVIDLPQIPPFPRPVPPFPVLIPSFPKSLSLAAVSKSAATRLHMPKFPHFLRRLGSNYSASNTKVHLFSWGDSVQSAISPPLSCPPGPLDNCSYGVLGGTSAAAAIVAGCACIAQQYFRSNERLMKSSEMRDALIKSGEKNPCDKIGVQPDLTQIIKPKVFANVKSKPKMKLKTPAHPPIAPKRK